MSEAYRTVTAKIRQVRTDSIMVEVPRQQGWKPIERALIHAGDDLKLDRLDVSGWGLEHTFRVFEWKAEELGLS